MAKKHTLYHTLLLPSGLLAGGIIGAGIFALPYLFAQSGLFAGFVHLSVGALAYTFIHLLYADVILRTPGTHRFVGRSKKYLGPRSFAPAVFITIVEMVFVMLQKIT